MRCIAREEGMSLVVVWRNMQCNSAQRCGIDSSQLFELTFFDVLRHFIDVIASVSDYLACTIPVLHLRGL